MCLVGTFVLEISRYRSEKIRLADFVVKMTSLVAFLITVIAKGSFSQETLKEPLTIWTHRRFFRSKREAP